MPKLHFVVGCALALIGATPLTASELAKRDAQMEEVHRHIVSHDFAWLDRSERTLRLQRSRTATGVWKLEIFYNAMWYLGQRASAPDCTDTAEPVLEQWRNNSPSSPAPFIASADRLLETGWCFRGSGFAGTIDNASWRPFHEHVDAAYRMLVDHKEVASGDPHYYAVMAAIYVAQERNPREFRALQNTRVGRDPAGCPGYAIGAHVSRLRALSCQRCSRT